jgi:hypothetical protein
MYNAFKKIETIIWKHIPEEKNIEVWM